MRQGSNTATARPDLGQVAYETMSGAGTSGFIADMVMPMFRTEKQSGIYRVIPAEAMLNLEDTKRAARSKYNRSDWEYENGLYSTKENGWEEPVDDRESSLNADVFDDEILATNRAIGVILRSKEKRVADKVFNPTVFTGVTGVTNEWDDAANATPLTDVKTAKLKIMARGIVPNALIINWKTFEDLKHCAQIIDRIKYTFPMIDMENIGTMELAKVFGLPYILVAGGMYNQSKKGQSASFADLWNREYAMVTRVSNSPDITEPCIGRTMLWTRESPEDVVVEMYRDEAARGDVVRVRHDTDEMYIRSVQSDNTTTLSNIAVACSELLSNIYTSA